MMIGFSVILIVVFISIYIFYFNNYKNDNMSCIFQGYQNSVEMAIKGLRVTNTLKNGESASLINTASHNGRIDYFFLIDDGVFKVIVLNDGCVLEIERQ